MQPTTQMAFTDHMRPIKNPGILFPKQRNFPFFTILLGLLVSIITLSPQMTSWMQFDRSAILHGELWRILTGHFTHWSVSHLFWDMLVFLVLAGTIERFNRRQLLTCFAIGSFFISLLVFSILPEMTYYRGLSGIDSGLFMLLLVVLYRRNTSGRKVMHKIPYILIGLFFVGKSALELSTAQTLFVQPSSLFIPVPLAHLGGAFVGGVIGNLHSKRHITL
jgi:rhomboid family GlyGly-CTERM serine protease